MEQNDWSNIVTSISDDQSDWQEENKKKDQEARQKKADEWEEKHKDDWIILVFLIVIPAIAGVIGIVFMRKRLDHLNEIEKKIVEAEADAQKIDDETMAHRSKVEEIRKKMVLLYRELVALDPYPESKV